MPSDDTRQRFLERYVALQTASRQIKQDLTEYMHTQPRIDKIEARPKSPDRFFEKCDRQEDDKPKYTEPLEEIQDQIGARIVTYYLADVERLANAVKTYYGHVEDQKVEPQNASEFSYMGRHFVLFIPDEIRTSEFKSVLPPFFELQIKTLFQHAWSEAEHDLNYKAVTDLSVEDKRLVAFSAAQAWGADREFDSLFQRYRPDP